MSIIGAPRISRRRHVDLFVGASTHPGTGMPTALISARLVAQRMMEDLVP